MNYYCTNELNSKLSGLNATVNFSAFYINIRSLNANHSKLIDLLDCLSIKYDCIILSEIWKCNLNFYSNLLKGYNYYYVAPAAYKAGGVCIYVKQEFVANILFSSTTLNNALLNSLFECLVIEVTINTIKHIIIVTYRHPNTSISDFTHNYFPLVNKFLSHKNCWLFGDYNINLQKIFC